MGNGTGPGGGLVCLLLNIILAFLGNMFPELSDVWTEISGSIDDFCADESV